MKDTLITSILSLLAVVVVLGALWGGYELTQDATAQAPVQRHFDVIGPYDNHEDFQASLNNWMTYINPECVTDVDFSTSGRYSVNYSALIERWC